MSSTGGRWRRELAAVDGRGNDQHRHLHDDRATFDKGVAAWRAQVPGDDLHDVRPELLHGARGTTMVAPGTMYDSTKTTPTKLRPTGTTPRNGSTGCRVRPVAT